MPQEVRTAVAGHLEHCVACRRDYERSKLVLGILKANHCLAAESEGAEVSHILSRDRVDLNWQYILARIRESEGCGNLIARDWFSGVRKLAVAACILIGVLSLAFVFFAGRQTPAERGSPLAGAGSRDGIRIELLSDQGRVFLNPDSEIHIEDGQSRTLFLNERHRMVLAGGTVLRVRPLTADSRLGCMVQLDAGRILANVRHDGNPFVVATAHGKAVITGTTFDVQVTDHATTLIVAEGSVRFESQASTVQVGAGYLSRITQTSGALVASAPVTCDAYRLTHWALETKPETFAATTTRRLPDRSEVDLLAGGEEVRLEDIDYQEWVEKNRSWFQQQFPEVFRLEGALANEGIEVDYPELLLGSGLLLEFEYPPAQQERLVAPATNRLIALAAGYGFDSQWTISKLSLSSAVAGLQEPELLRSSVEAFATWRDTLRAAEKTGKRITPTTELVPFQKNIFNICDLATCA
ncbi:MAG TPA: FecR family protein, partial [Phycisphaerae bacterium]|nr:FecR family protein [Phycisphaerae bacterium]HRT52104.1 FecR family protein [Anaerohalosphaeraceae bacterium]